MRPSYLKLVESGEFATRVEALRGLIAPCRLCPRECGVDRTAGETGYCRSGAEPIVAGHASHFGEEAPLVGTGGSGTIFLANCNLGCVFCQNYDISQLGRGRPVSPAAIAEMMLELQAAGCHNVNLVTPTHFAPALIEAVGIAAEHGLRVPIVWNCGGYESMDVLRLLDGTVDIYMPDAKYADAEVSARLSDAPDYPMRMREALAEMHRQVGDLTIDARGIAEKGLLVRHLVLPGGLAGTPQIAGWIAELSRDTYVNVMAQYRPCHRAREYPEINRRPTGEEYRAAVESVRNAGLMRLDAPGVDLFL